MRAALLVIVTILLIKNNSVECRTPTWNNSERQTMVVRRVFEQLFDLKAPTTHDTSMSGHFSPVIPSYMTALYQRYLKSRRSTGETVRSILPIKGQIKFGGNIATSSLLLFNISCFGVDDEVTQAQLHLHRRRSTRHSKFQPHHHRSRMLAPPARVRVLSLQKGRRGKSKLISLASVPIAQTSRGGWTTLDITSAVRELLVNTPVERLQKNLTLAIRFDSPRGRIIRPYNFLDSRTSNESFSALLVVFSQYETENQVPPKPFEIDPEHKPIIANLLTTGTTKPTNKHRHKPPNSHRDNQIFKITSDNRTGDINDLIALNSLYEKHRFETINRENFIPKLDQSNVMDETEKKTILKRSIDDNELPVLDQETDVRDGFNELSFDKKEHVGEKTPPNLIPYPTHATRKHRKKKHHIRRNRKDKNQRGRNIQSAWIQWDKETDLDSYKSNLDENDEQSNENICHRERLVVNFADIGWSRWIIAPKSFEAHFCAGSCPFPLTKEMKPTNHASVQSLVNMVGSYKDVPPPCCVPDALSPVTLLYTDQAGNVVLRNYPGMTVDTCACR